MGMGMKEGLTGKGIRSKIISYYIDDIDFAVHA